MRRRLRLKRRPTPRHLARNTRLGTKSGAQSELHTALQQSKFGLVSYIWPHFLMTLILRRGTYKAERRLFFVVAFQKRAR